MGEFNDAVKDLAKKAVTFGGDIAGAAGGEPDAPHKLEKSGKDLKDATKNAFKNFKSSFKSSKNGR